MAEKAADIVRKARAQLTELTGREPEGVLGVERDDEDGWRVTLEVLELSRVPNTMDLLGSYVVRVDDGGDLLEYSRTRRYARGQADDA
jgi:hypothetical protein